MTSIGVVLNMISSTMRTEELLQELQKSNVELEAQAKELEEKFRTQSFTLDDFLDPRETVIHQLLEEADNNQFVA